MATIQSLAPEILSHIFELAHDAGKPSTMCAAARVCRTWRDPAQRTLFLDIVVPMMNNYDTPGGRTSNAFVVSRNHQHDVEHWDAYRSSRLYSPRRAELLGRYSTWSRKDLENSLSLISGVKDFKVSMAGLPIDFWDSPDLQDLERLDIMSILHFPPRPGGSAGWPRNLRSVRSTLSFWFELQRSYTPPTTLVSLSLDFSKSILRSDALKDATIIPATVVDLSITLSVPSGIPHLLPFFAAVQNLHHITLDFLPHQSYISVFSFFGSLAGFLPASIKRLSIKNVGDPNTTAYPLAYTPFLDLLDLISTDRLPNLTRIDFPVCKRKDLEDEAAAADLLAECERHSIRIVCWEDFI